LSSSLTKVALQKFYLMACNKYYLISFSCTILLFTNFNFSYSWALRNYMQKWPVFMRISWKNSDLNFVFMQNFVQKKLFISNECAISFKTGFVLIRKWCEISCKKSHFVQNHATVVQENWLSRGNPTLCNK